MNTDLPEVITRPEVTTIFQVIPDDELEKPYRVIIENDDETPMDFVVLVLRYFFGIELTQAMEIMLTAHNEGRALVTILPFEEAQQRVYEAHSAAREAGYPLTFYLEPDS